MAAPQELEELGRRIRMLRGQNQLTLKELEGRCGLSSTHLSDIERGRTSPTVGALIRIARSLGSDPTFLVEPEELGEPAVIRRGERRLSNPLPGIAVNAMTPGIPGSMISAQRVVLDPQPAAEWSPGASEYSSDALCFVARGTVEALVGDTWTSLRQGDALHAPQSRLVRIRSASTEVAEVIVVRSRPLDEIE